MSENSITFVVPQVADKKLSIMIKVGSKFKFQQGNNPIEIVKITEIFGNPSNPLENPKQTIRVTSKSYKDNTMYLSALIVVNERLTK